MRHQVERVVVYPDHVEIVKSKTEVDGTVAEDDGNALAGRTIVVPAKLAHRSRAVILDDGRSGPDPILLRALGRAHEWRGWLDEARRYRIALSLQKPA